MLAFGVVGLAMGMLAVWWLERDVAAPQPRLMAAASRERVTVALPAVSPDGEQAFVLAGRKRTGPWATSPRLEGTYRAVALRGAETYVFFAPEDGYSIYRDGARVRSEAWPFKWEPRAACGWEDGMWAVGVADGKLCSAVQKGATWTQDEAKLPIAGAAVGFGAYAHAGKRYAWLETGDSSPTPRRMVLYQYDGKTWARVADAELPRGTKKAAIMQVGTEVWRVGLREDEVLTATCTSEAARASTPMQVEGVNDFALIVADSKPTLVVIQDGAVRMAELRRTPGMRWEVVYPRSAGSEVMQWVSSLSTALMFIAFLAVGARLFMRPGQETGLGPDAGLVAANMVRRIVAIGIDYSICGLATGGILVSIYGNDMPSEQGLVAAMFLAIQAYRLVGLAGQEYFMGQTIGKRLMRLRVVQTDGGRLTLANALIRNLVRVIDEDFLFVGLPLMLWSPRRQRLGDMAAHTIVVPDSRDAEQDAAMDDSTG